MDTTSPHEQPEPTRHAKPNHRGRWIAAGTAGAIMLAAGGFGLGRALDSPGSDSGGASPSPSARSVIDGGGYAGSGQGFGRGYGQQASPFQAGDVSRAATSDELTGLVRIDSTQGYADGEAAGTGMVLTSDGEVVTNHHVVAGATSIEVTVMSTGDTYQAKVVGTDANDDVAVIQLKNASGLDPVDTDPSGVAVGDKVTAVGDANGTADQLTAAEGVVSRLGQEVTTQSEGASAGESLTGMIEISSDVISGDSGGATYNEDGDVVGMTTAASSGSTDIVGYAIPIAKVLDVADDLQNGVANAAYVYGNPAFLGIGLSQDGTVQQVYDDSAAADAGISAGDTITRLASTEVSSADALSAAVRTHSPGDKVEVTWTDTAGQSHTVTLKLGSGPVS